MDEKRGNQRRIGFMSSRKQLDHSSGPMSQDENGKYLKELRNLLLPCSEKDTNLIHRIISDSDAVN